MSGAFLCSDLVPSWKRSEAGDSYECDLFSNCPGELLGEWVSMADQGKKPSKGETPGKIPAAVRSCREIWGEGHGPAFMLPLPCHAHPGETMTPGLFKVSLWLQHREAPVARSVLRREFQVPALRSKSTQKLGDGLLKRPGDSRALWVVGRVVWHSASCRGARRVSLESSVGIFSGRQWR